MKYTAELIQDDPAEMPENDLVTIGYTSTRHCLGTKRCTGDELAAIEKSSAIWIPVYAYIHSGTTIATTPFSCPWDSGQCGIAWMSKEAAISNWGKKAMTPKVREKAIAYIEGHIKTFDQWVQGDVWGYQIKDENDEVVDSCWGFFGQDYAEQEMLEALAGYQQDANDADNLAMVQAGVLCAARCTW